uniref:Amino acid transporter transmembrane domain-containing protein n=1 Tax=Fagus sylvatica TaxID=28930 RepID=A0A2N9GJZ7_FAGSY
MKVDEDLGRDLGDEFHTDDEENLAETICGNEDETESEVTSSSPSQSDNTMDLNYSSWPQSYRQSMDMFTSVTPPSISFLRGASLTGGVSSFLSTAYKRPKPSECDSSLSRPLIPEVLSSTSPEKLSASTYSKVSFSVLPPPQEQCSFSQAVINGINVLCGIGLLTTPYAIKEGGWLSLIILLILGILCCYTGVLLKQCLESSPGLQTYPDIGQAAFGLAGRLGIAATCVEYIIMMGDNLASLFPNTNISFAGINLGSHQIFAITATLIILPTVWLRNLSLLSYLSGGGVVASILVVLCLLWVGVVDQVGFHQSGTALDLANLSVTIVESQFTLNMPREYVASKIAVWTMVVNPLTKYALNLTPITLSLEELLPEAQLRSYSVVLLIRTILVFSTLVVALTFPYFAIVMALIGSLLAMLIVLIFPCACYLSLLRDRIDMACFTLLIYVDDCGVTTALGIGLRGSC